MVHAVSDKRIAADALQRISSSSLKPFLICVYYIMLCPVARDALSVGILLLYGYLPMRSCRQSKTRRCTAAAAIHCRQRILSNGNLFFFHHVSPLPILLLIIMRTHFYEIIVRSVFRTCNKLKSYRHPSRAARSALTAV